MKIVDLLKCSTARVAYEGRTLTTDVEGNFVVREDGADAPLVVTTREEDAVAALTDGAVTPAARREMIAYRYRLLSAEDRDTLFRRVRTQPESPSAVVVLLGIPPKDVENWVYESCSLVVALTDRETILEVCHTPRLVEVWREPEHQLFG
jgi:hypothetical protein